MESQPLPGTIVRRAMPAIDAILLDLYETLVWPDWARLDAGRAELAARAGVDAAAMRDQWRRTHETRMRGRLGGLEGDLAEMLAACGKPVDPALLHVLARHEYANWAAGVCLYGDVLPQLRRLREHGFRLAIVSNASCEAASVVRTLGLDRVVDALVLSCEVGAIKPEPAILRLALERFDVAPDRALLLDDAVVNLDAARVLGLHTALMDRSAGSHSDVTGHPRITGLEDLWPLLAAVAAPTASRPARGLDED
jgi:HAD superfamily hydrolase (TIGR01509 family)